MDAKLVSHQRIPLFSSPGVPSSNALCDPGWCTSSPVYGPRSATRQLVAVAGLRDAYQLLRALEGYLLQNWRFNPWDVHFCQEHCLPRSPHYPASHTPAMIRMSQKSLNHNRNKQNKVNKQIKWTYSWHPNCVWAPEQLENSYREFMIKANLYWATRNSLITRIKEPLDSVVPWKLGFTVAAQSQSTWMRPV